MARTAEQPAAHDGNDSPLASRRRFLRAAVLGAGALVLGACSKRATEGESAEANESEEAAAVPRLPSAEPVVRVRLRALDPGERVTLGPAGQWLRVSAPDEARTLAVLRGPLEVFRRDGAWSVVDGRGFSPWVTDAGAIAIAPLRDAEATMQIDGKAYPGAISLHARTDRHADAFDLISHVALESYLPGVLARELYNHWHQETHTAQAIAARSFAVAEAWFWQRRRHYDLVAGEASQMYDGITTHAKSLEAVRATRGVVLAYHDQVVPGYYSASCGGLAATALDAISDSPINNVPPLMGHAGECPCAQLDQQRWSVTQDISTLTARLQAFGKAYNLAALTDLERIGAIELSASNPHGRPTQFRMIASASQQVEIAAERLRWAANFADTPLPRKERLLSSFVEPQLGGSRVTFHGRGHGHGAGLCQYGAEAMAKSGMPYIDIIKWFYPGVEIVGTYS